MIEEEQQAFSAYCDECSKGSEYPDCPLSAKDMERCFRMFKVAFEAGKRLTQSIVDAVRPIMELVSSWDCDPRDTVVLHATAKQIEVLCQAFNEYDGKE